MQCNPCKRKRSNLWEVMWPPLLTLVVVLAGWEIIVQAFHVHLVVIPAPSVIFRETVEPTLASAVAGDWLYHGKNRCIGYLSGVPHGIVIGRSFPNPSSSPKPSLPW